jgi:hypothetical protein
MTYRIKRVSYEEIELDRADLMTLTEAAEILGLTLPGVISAMDRGRLSEIINDEAPNPQHGRRLVLRADVASEQHRRDNQEASAAN